MLYEDEVIIDGNYVQVFSRQNWKDFFANAVKIFSIDFAPNYSTPNQSLKKQIIWF